MKMKETLDNGDNTFVEDKNRVIMVEALRRIKTMISSEFKAMYETALVTLSKRKVKWHAGVLEVDLTVQYDECDSATFSKKHKDDFNAIIVVLHSIKKTMQEMQLAMLEEQNERMELMKELNEEYMGNVSSDDDTVPQL